MNPISDEWNNIMQETPNKKSKEAAVKWTSNTVKEAVMKETGKEATIKRIAKEGTDNKIRKEATNKKTRKEGTVCTGRETIKKAVK